MLHALPIDLRTRISGEDPKAYQGRLGLLLYDRDTQAVIAIAAAQVAGWSPGLYIDGVVVAERRDEDLPFEPRSTRPASDMLWPLRVLPSFPLADTQIVDRSGKPVGGPKLMRDVDVFLGERVLIQTDARKPRVARLRSTSARFRMPPPGTRDSVLFYDAMEISPLDSEPVTKAGDAGAVVTTMDGHPIGTIICGTESESYAAPLGRFIDALGGTTMLTHEIIKTYNGEIGSHAVSRKHQPPRALDFEKAKAAVESPNRDVRVKAAQEIEEALFEENFLDAES
jgi:hypothetical protein